MESERKNKIVKTSCIKSVPIYVNTAQESHQPESVRLWHFQSDMECEAGGSGKGMMVGERNMGTYLDIEIYSPNAAKAVSIMFSPGDPKIIYYSRLPARLKTLNGTN